MATRLWGKLFCEHGGPGTTILIICCSCARTVHHAMSSPVRVKQCRSPTLPKECPLARCMLGTRVSGPNQDHRSAAACIYSARSTATATANGRRGVRLQPRELERDQLLVFCSSGRTRQQTKSKLYVLVDVVDRQRCPSSLCTLIACPNITPRDSAAGRKTP